MTRRLGNVSTKIWRADDLGGAELLRGSFSNYAYDVHTHDRACFALITRGAIRTGTPGSEFVAQAGDLYAIDADEPHPGWPSWWQGRNRQHNTLAVRRTCIGS
jgi:hypothetical protein